VAVLSKLPRWISVPVAIVAVALNITVDNQFFYQLKRNGTGSTFSDAIFPLSESLADRSGQMLYVTDWGIYDSLNLLHRGQLPLTIATDFALDNPNPQQVEGFNRMLSNPNGLFIGHIPQEEFFVGGTKHLENFAATAGKRREIVRIVPDSNGRPMFEISRVVPLP
jgi:hypothetical protein